MMHEYDVFFFFFCVLFGRGMSRERKERRKEGRKEGRKEAKKKRNEEIPPLFTTKLGLFFFFDSCIYLVITLLYICFDVNFN